MGRPRKQGKRERNGQLQRLTEEETAWETKRPTLEKRCDMLGWFKDKTKERKDGTEYVERVYKLEDLRKVDRYGTFHGLYFLAGLLSERRHEAADRFSVLRREYVIAEGLPADTAPAASWGEHTGPSPVGDPSEADLRKVAAYRSLKEDVGLLYEAVARDLVIGKGFSDAMLLFDALDAVADFLMLEE